MSIEGKSEECSVVVRYVFLGEHITGTECARSIQPRGNIVASVAIATTMMSGIEFLLILKID